MTTKATASKEKQQITKDDVGDFSSATSTALIKPPTTLTFAGGMTEAEKAFLDEAKEQPSGPTKLPTIAIDHKSMTFVMPSGEKIDGQDGIMGFIVAHFTTRTYYEKAYNPKGEPVPPDCKSIDCITPDADSPKKQAESCAACPHNVFGSATVGKGKACKEYIRMFLVNPEFGEPPLAMLTLPPSSIAKFYGGTMMIGGKRGYLDQLKSKHRAWQIVWTKITLTRESEDAIHCTPAFEMGDIASLDVARALAQINNQYVDAIKRMRKEVTSQGEKESNA